MLSAQVLTRQNVGALAKYYEDGADDYYAKEGDANEWQGHGAETLGLHGQVDPSRFRELLTGKVGEGVQISRGSTRSDVKERIGIDLTFSAPKSVSLQALVGGDPALIKAHDRAVAAAVSEAELKVQGRKKVNGKASVEHTANLIAAKFRHETSREQDPQLHTHAVVMNITQRADGEWRAIKNDELLRNVKELGTVYRTELAKAAKEAGYELRYDSDGSWELAHITRDELMHFSQRSQGIEDALEAQGKTRATASAAEKQQITMRTRAKKQETDRDTLYQHWVGRANDLGIDFNRREWKGAGYAHAPDISARSDTRTPEAIAREAVRFAIKHIGERDAVMSESRLVDTALKHGQGRFSIKEVRAEVASQRQKGYLIEDEPLYRPANAMDTKQDMTQKQWIDLLVEKGLSPSIAKKQVHAGITMNRLVQQERRFTTQTARDRERRILAIERDGRGSVSPLMSRERAFQRLEGLGLNGGQRDASTMILTTANRVVGIQGFAGVGKTTLLKPAKAELEAQGYEVRAVAPTGSQVKALQGADIPAQTLASFLVAKDKGLSERTVLILDEAGSVPTREMDRLMKLAEQAGARLIMAGDVAQTKAIEAGRPFDQLQDAGMVTARVDEIVRQRNGELKTAVEFAANGRTDESLQKIQDVSEYQEAETRHRAIVDRYMAMPADERDNTIIVSGTNEARREINRMVREESGLSGKGIMFDTLVRRDTTQAQRRFSHSYQVGDVIQPDQDYKCGLVRGETYRILDTGPGNRLTVEAVEKRAGAKPEQISFSPRTHTALSVYRPEVSELAVGDKVRITHNDARRDLANGDRYVVEAVAPGKVTFSGKGRDGEVRSFELPTDKPLHVDHAYASTVHASQGLTVKNVLIDAMTKSRTLTKDVWYVAISRATHTAQVFADSLKDLPKAIAREAGKTAALDFERDRFRFEKVASHARQQHQKPSAGLERGR